MRRATHEQQPPHSVLGDLGEEITGIVTPVSICMALTVLLVKALNPDGDDAGASTVVIASLAYSEQVPPRRERERRGGAQGAAWNGGARWKQAAAAARGRHHRTTRT
jgi:hypothetical protein